MERAITIGLVSFLVLVGGLPSFVGAEEAATGDDADEWMALDTDDWGVAISAEIDLLMYGAKGGFDSNLEPRTSLPPDADGTEFVVIPMYGLAGEVTSPVIFDIPGRPRLYFGAGIRYAQELPHTYAFAGDRPLPLPEVKDFFTFKTFSTPGVMGSNQFTYPETIAVGALVFGPGGDVPVDPSTGEPFLGGLQVHPECPDSACSLDFVAGQGATLSAYNEPLFWQTEFGFVFSVPLEERTLRIKPAVGYFQHQVTITGATSRVYREEAPCASTTEQPADNCTRLRAGDFKPGDRDFATAEFGSTATKTFRALGPKLTLELDTARFKSLGQRIGASIYADIGVFWTMSDRRVEFSGGQLVADEDFPIRPNGSASPRLRTKRFGLDHVPFQKADYFFELDKLSYRFGIGFRLTWFPL